MKQIGRKYMVQDTRAKALALDEHNDPLRFASLDEALAKAIELRGRKSAEAFAVVDDLGNKWMWSPKKVLRVALSYDTKHVIEEAIDVDWEEIASLLGSADETIEHSTPISWAVNNRGLSELVRRKRQDNASPQTETLRLFECEEVSAVGGRADERHGALPCEQVGEPSSWYGLEREA
jgi:hypothetical protein